ncbi:hypothetical protein ILYODFUR_036564 [Ilyodon furcidens]|uniref:Uncharacterized protein n=1 Tax=Ilyodon furcidens TaxID=33524 RepID=A0ABV0V943_9TELE
MKTVVFFTFQLHALQLSGEVLVAIISMLRRPEIETLSPPRRSSLHHRPAGEEDLFNNLYFRDVSELKCINRKKTVDVSNRQILVAPRVGSQQEKPEPRPSEKDVRRNSAHVGGLVAIETERTPDDLHDEPDHLFHSDTKTNPTANHQRR